MNGKNTLSGYSTVYNSLNEIINDPAPMPDWKADLPTRPELHKINFGQPSKNRLFVQETYFETCVITILMSGYLSYYEFATLCDTHVLVSHMVKMFIKCHSYDFT